MKIIAPVCTLLKITQKLQSYYKLGKAPRHMAKVRNIRDLWLAASEKCTELLTEF